MVKRVVFSWHCSHVVRDAVIFKAPAFVGPAISGGFFVNLELYCDAHTLQNLILVTDTTLLRIAFQKDGFFFTFRGGADLLRELAPETKIKSIFRVLLLPSELDVLSQRARREPLDGVVSVELLLVSLSRPVKMQTEGFSIAKRHCVLIERKVWEVVLSMISSEVVWCDAVGEVACVFITVLSSAIVCHHYQHVALCLVRRHYTQGHLDFLKRISCVGVGNSGA